MTKTQIIDIKQNEHDYALKDIVFEIDQIERAKKLREGIIFTKACKNLTSAVKTMQENKKRLINEYKARYQKDPDIEAAKRLFDRDTQTDGITRGEAGNANNDNPGLKR